MPKYIPIHTNTCSLIQYVPIRPLHIPDEVQISPHVQISPQCADFPSTLYDFPHSLCSHCSEHVRNGRRGSRSRRESGSKIKMLAVSLGRRSAPFQSFFSASFSVTSTSNRNCSCGQSGPVCDRRGSRMPGSLSP